MASTSQQWVCSFCNQSFPKWTGQCPNCEEWGGIEAVQTTNAPLSSRAAWKGKGWNVDAGSSKARRITDIKSDEVKRLSTSISELDRVMGCTGSQAGVVPGSLTLLTGAPGCGKSSLLTMAADGMARTLGPVLYASGEESVSQIKMRADRFGAGCRELYLYPEVEVESIIEQVQELRPVALIVDSIQTTYLKGVDSSVGSQAQVKECTSALLHLAKTTGIPIFLVGHMTKDGVAAGPRLMEHAVDAVLYLEGDKNGQYRILRAEKNRFGSTFEIGIFEMHDTGMIEVPNPSESLLRGRNPKGSGSVVVSVLDGVRPMLVEIQVLTNPCLGSPRRSVNGADKLRVDLMVAVLSRHAAVPIADEDVYVNVVGGLRVTEPGADLGIVLAGASSIYNVPVGQDVITIGEVGLSGEVRSVSGIERRMSEAVRMGFTKIIIPKASGIKIPKGAGVDVVQVSDINQALNYVFPNRPKR